MITFEQLIRRLREFSSLIIAQALTIRGCTSSRQRWVKCTRIRKHESRFYQWPEVPLKYPHRARASGWATEGRQLALSPSSPGIPASGSPARYARYFQLFQVLARNLSNMARDVPLTPFRSQPPATPVCYKEKLSRGINPTGKPRDKVSLAWGLVLLYRNRCNMVVS